MKKFIQAAVTGLVLIVLCGFAYPLLVLGIGRLAFSRQAGGSIVYVDGKAAGSELIGQDFKDNRFFHDRVSSVNYDTFTADTDIENIKPSSGSYNYASSDKALGSRIKGDIAEFLKENPTVSAKDLPADLFTCSASGLDPDISPAAAEAQVDRIVSSTGITKERVERIVSDCTTGRDIGIFGEKRVNVLKANLEIYKLLKNK